MESSRITSARYRHGNPVKMQAIRETGAGRENLELSAVYTTLHVEDEVRLGSRMAHERDETLDVVTLPVESAYEERLLTAAREAVAHSQDDNGGLGPRDSRKLTALEAAAGCPRLVLLGAAGSGKSTFGKHLALAMAGQVLDWSGASIESLNRPSGDAPWTPAYRAWPHGALVPIFVELLDFVGSGAFPETEDKATAENLFDYLASRDVNPIQHGVLQDPGGNQGQRRPSHPRRPRRNPQGRRTGRLREVITRFTKTYPECRVLVTSRPYAYKKTRSGVSTEPASRSLRSNLSIPRQWRSS